MIGVAEEVFYDQKRPRRKDGLDEDRAAGYLLLAGAQCRTFTKIFCEQSPRSLLRECGNAARGTRDRPEVEFMILQFQIQCAFRTGFRSLGIATLPGYFDPAMPCIVKVRARALRSEIESEQRHRAVFRSSDLFSADLFNEGSGPPETRAMRTNQNATRGALPQTPERAPDLPGGRTQGANAPNVRGARRTPRE